MNFGPRSSLAKCLVKSGSNLLHTLMVFLKDLFEKKKTLVNVMSLCWYLRVLPVLHRADMVGIFIFVGVNTKKKNMPYAKGTIDFNHFKVFSMCMSIYVSI